MKLHRLTRVGVILLALILGLGLSMHSVQNVQVADKMTAVVGIDMALLANCDICCKDADFCTGVCNAGFLCGQMAISVDTAYNAFETAMFDVPYRLAGVDPISSPDPHPPKRHPLA